MAKKFLIGIDEVGRGPLAGPVVVAGIKIVSSIKYPALSEARPDGRQVLRTKKLKDSKKLTARQREEWFKILTRHPKIEYAIAKIFPKVIDRINISQAANLGVRRVYEKLSGGMACHAMLDGSLKLPPHISHEVIIKGDEKIPVISAASIIAKVTRDRLMLRLHKKYPEYRFDLHKGYGTKLHRDIVRKIGRSRVHRQSFRIS